MVGRTLFLLLNGGAALLEALGDPSLPQQHAAPRAAPLLQECRVGCLVALEQCNASDATQLWDYQVRSGGKQR